MSSVYMLLDSSVSRFWVEYGRVFDAISLDPGVRAVVVASALPKLFSAGIDCESAEGHHAALLF